MQFVRSLLRIVALFVTTTLFATHCLAESVVTTIPVYGAHSVTVNPLTRLVYVTAGDSIAVIDERTNTQIDTIRLNGALTGVEVNPVTSRLYVSDFFYGNIYVIDTRTNLVVTVIPVLDGSPETIAVNTRTNKIYVTEKHDEKVLVIDGATNAIVGSIVGPVLPYALAMNSVTNRLYISDNNYYGGVAVVDGRTDQVIAEIPTAGQYTYGVAVDFVHNLIYASDETVLNEIDGRTNKLVRTLPLQNALSRVAVNPFTRRIYVGNFEMNTWRFSQIAIIDGKEFRQIGSLPTGSHPDRLHIDLIRKMLYVCNVDDWTVTAISTRVQR